MLAAKVNSLAHLPPCRLPSEQFAVRSSQLATRHSLLLPLPSRWNYFIFSPKLIIMLWQNRTEVDVERANKQTVIIIIKVGKTNKHYVITSGV